MLIFHKNLNFSLQDEKKDDEERKPDYKKVVITEVSSEGRIYAQNVTEGPKLEQLMKDIRTEFSSSPPLAGAYQPKRGEI